MQLYQVLKTWAIAGGQLVAEFMGGLKLNAALYSPQVAVAYGATVIINPSQGSSFVVTITDGVAFAIAAPTPTPPTGYRQVINVTFVNASGGAAGAGTFDAIFKMASNTLAVIANGKNRTYQFQWNGANWVQTFVSAADIAN